MPTVNDELGNRNAELNRLNNDLSNLHASLNTAIVVLSRHLTVLETIAIKPTILTRMLPAE